MRKLAIILLLTSAASASIFLNSFNSGQMDIKLKIRHDLDQTSMGSETLQNILIRPQGMAFKRPGTEFIDYRIQEVNIPTTTTVTTGEYPTLQVADGTFVAQQADPGLTHTTAIANVNDLQAMNNDLTGNYYLTADIDASATSAWNGGAGFVPIGDNLTPFLGTLDGCGYTITGLTINRNSTYQGLFGQIGPNSGGVKVYNLTLSAIDIQGSGGFCGGLAGAIDGEGLSLCTVSGIITALGSAVSDFGGMVGRTDGDATIYDCQSSVVVDAGSSHTDTSPQYVGGFVGQAGSAAVNTIFDNCRSTGNVTGTGVGGSSGDSVGGFAGYSEEYATFQDCAATGDVSGDSTVGGFIGEAAVGTTFTRCSARGDVSIAAVTGGGGGFAGTASGTGGDTSAFTDCYSWGNVNAVGLLGYAGGFGQYVYGDVQTTNCYSIGTVTGAGGVGGYMQFTDNSGAYIPTITASFWDTESSGEEDGIGFDDAPLITAPTGNDTDTMKTQTTFTDAGWDFDTIWDMNETETPTTTIQTLSLADDNAVRLIPFEYATNDAYVLEFGHRYIGFLRTTP